MNIKRLEELRYELIEAQNKNVKLINAIDIAHTELENAEDNVDKYAGKLYNLKKNRWLNDDAITAIKMAIL